MQMFPCLKSKPMLMSEFERITGEGMVLVAMGRWDLLMKVLGCEPNNIGEEVEAVHTMEKEVMSLKMKKKGINSIMKKITSSGDGEEDIFTVSPTVTVLEQVERAARIITLIGAEKTLVAKLSEPEQLMAKTLTTLLAIYYVYDVSYREEHYSFLCLMQDVLLRVADKSSRPTRTRSYAAYLINEMDELASQQGH
ncbi:uncharacterized protein LOC134181264 [Corticium candelabrum]|uniref:uncharacterized protein LOC134181264 n=1 Tax=Corticium candelabrum TaxID=121492 RepID=UPI002E260D84|nr:uncharacterized protein LOC134181264 [Corticium candelabrum]